MEKDVSVATRRLDARLRDCAPSPLNLPPAALQRQLAATGPLDGAIRAVGTAAAALAARAHREGAAIAASFLSEPAATAAAGGGEGEGAGAGGGAAGGASKVLKMGDAAMKRLRNGDIYKVRCGGLGGGAAAAVGCGWVRRSWLGLCIAGERDQRSSKPMMFRSRRLLHPAHGKCAGGRRNCKGWI